MKRSSILGLVAFLAASSAHAQVDPDRMRFELVTGVIQQGKLADASFQVDFSSFGGDSLGRTGGTLDVDPTVSIGFRGVYRVNPRWAIRASWTHAEGRYRVQFPAESETSGNFDLEGLLLAGNDFQTGGQEGQRAQQAMSNALTDIYAIDATFEFPIMDRWAFPYFTLGGGVYKNKSDGAVIRFQYEGDVPVFDQVLENSGTSQAEVLGLSKFAIDSIDPMVSLGAGFRISAGKRWAVDFSIEDYIRVGADLSHVNETATPPPDANVFRVYSTTFAGTEGLIHNWSAQISLGYAIWPYGTPR